MKSRTHGGTAVKRGERGGLLPPTDRNKDDKKIHQPSPVESETAGRRFFILSAISKNIQ